MSSYQPVEAVVRAFKVLETVSKMGECSVQDIHHEIGESKATIVRMLETLESVGYIGRVPNTSRYGLTGRVLFLKAGFRVNDLLGSRVEPILAALQAKIGWPSDFAIYDGDDMIVVVINPAGGRFFSQGTPGRRIPVLGTSLGLAYLAYATETEQQRALAMSAGRAEHWNDIARAPKEAAALFARIRERGYATAHPAYGATFYDGSIPTLAVPVLLDGRPVGAINVKFARAVLSMEAAVDSLIAPMRESADLVAQVLRDLDL
ncbi:MAG: helix-turn-helix domain-containing protein [Sphingobium sp.]